MNFTELERAISALDSLDAGCSREEWVRIGMAVKAAGLSFEIFNNWSKNAGNYRGEKDCMNAWKSFSESGPIKAGTLFYMARAKGWKGQTREGSYTRNNNTHYQKKDEDSANIHKLFALGIWEKCLPAEDTHEYISRKQ